MALILSISSVPLGFLGVSYAEEAADPGEIEYSCSEDDITALNEFFETNQLFSLKLGVDLEEAEAEVDEAVGAVETAESVVEEAETALSGFRDLKDTADDAAKKYDDFNALKTTAAEAEAAVTALEALKTEVETAEAALEGDAEDPDLQEALKEAEEALAEALEGADYEKALAALTEAEGAADSALRDAEKALLDETGLDAADAILSRLEVAESALNDAVGELINALDLNGEADVNDVLDALGKEKVAADSALSEAQASLARAEELVAAAGNPDFTRGGVLTWVAEDAEVEDPETEGEVSPVPDPVGVAEPGEPAVIVRHLTAIDLNEQTKALTKLDLSDLTSIVTLTSVVYARASLKQVKLKKNEDSTITMKSGNGGSIQISYNLEDISSPEEPGAGTGMVLHALAVSNAGYLFTHWVIGEDEPESVTTLGVAVADVLGEWTGDYTATANFIEQTGGGGGTPAVDPTPEPEPTQDGWTTTPDGKKQFYENGELVTNEFKSDGTYTYFLQADGTPMTNRLSYHPDGQHIIYFDEQGHEVFNQFIFIKEVGYIGYFDSQGYLYKDVHTFNQAGAPVYIDGNGRLQQNGWFQFGNGLDIGYANADGSLINSQWSYNDLNQPVYFHWNGMVARGLITDGAWFYLMHETDGHLVGQFQQ
ncbi:hypothetical protein FACS1894111_01660 [Clostridia bacterium]|nr:hypothetical protein FACS1894111_01660 [Clostridia bacterium]